MGSMNTTDPNTWQDISQHPTFNGGDFDPHWYEGDVKEDLEKLRALALAIIAALPDYTCELVILDDCTMSLQVFQGRLRIAEIYPTTSDDGEAEYFLDIGSRDELRCKTTKEILDVLCEQSKPLVK
jgi:hypothetical protein